MVLFRRDADFERVLTSIEDPWMPDGDIPGASGVLSFRCLRIQEHDFLIAEACCCAAVMSDIDLAAFV